MKGGYNRHIDYCGPGESWLTRYIPNDLFGVNVNHCCYLHDVGWAKDGPRYKHEDKEFRNCIRAKFKAKASSEKRLLKYLGLRLAGFCISWLYYISVRLGSLHNRSKQ